MLRVAGLIWRWTTAEFRTRNKTAFVVLLLFPLVIFALVIDCGSTSLPEFRSLKRSSSCAGDSLAALAQEPQRTSAGNMSQIGGYQLDLWSKSWMCALGPWGFFNER